MPPRSKFSLCKLYTGMVLALVCGFPALGFGSLNWETQRIAVTAKPGEKSVTGIFRFTNAGDTPVTITSIQTSCGCTTAELEKRTYASGEHGEIKTVYDLAGAVGHQQKSITVTTDDAPEKPQALLLQATIPEWITCAPRLLLWRIDDLSEEKSVRITSIHPSKMTGIEIKVIAPEKEATTRFEPDPDGKGFRMFVRPAATGKTSQIALTCVAQFADGSTHPFSVFALVR